MSLIGGFTTGIQRSWTIIDNDTGLAVPFGGDVLDLQASPTNKEIEVNPISTQGFPKYKTARQGWRGTITVARGNADADNFEAVQEALYHQTGTQKYFTIIEATTEEDGSITTFQFTGAELAMEDSGTARSDAAVEIKLRMKAQARQPV